MRAIVAAIVVTAVSTLLAFGALAFSGQSSACSQYGSGGSQYGQYGGSGGSQYGQYGCCPGSSGGQYGSGGSQYGQYGGSGGAQYGQYGCCPGAGGGQYGGAGGAQYGQYGCQGGGPPSPHAFAGDNIYENVTAPPGADAVGASDPLHGGFLSFFPDLVNDGNVPLTGARFDIPGSSIPFAGTTFPLAATTPGDLQPGQSVQLTTTSLFQPNRDVTPGYDLTRSADTTTIAPGGGSVTETVSITPRDAEYSGGDLQLQLTANQFGGSGAASIETSSVVYPTLGAGEHRLTASASAGQVFWTIADPVIGKTYALTATVDVANTGTTPFAYKPQVFAGGTISSIFPAQTGTSTAILDPLLGTTLTYSVATPVTWGSSITHDVNVTLNGVFPPAFDVTVDRPAVTVHAGATFTENATVTPLSGFSGQVFFGLTGALDSNGVAAPLPPGIFMSGPWPLASVGPGSATVPLAIQLSPSLTPGTYTVELQAGTGLQPEYAEIQMTVLGALPQAYARDTRIQSEDFPSSVDSVSAALTYPNGTRTWRGSIDNFCGNTLSIPTPQISLAVPGPSWTFEPPVTFPLTQTLGHDLAPCSPTFELDQIAGYDQNLNASSSQAVGITVATGYDAQRTLDTTSIAPGGGDQTVTATITLRDAAYLHGNAEFTIGANWYGGTASIDTANVTTGGVTTEGSFFNQLSPSIVDLTLTNVQLNTPYTLTVHIHVPNNTGSPLAYKPMVILHAIHDNGLSPVEDAASTTIDDPVLGGTFTFSAGADVRWQRSLTDVTETNFEPVTLPPFALVVDQPSVSVPAGGSFDENATATPVNGFTGTASFWLSGGPAADGSTLPTPDGFSQGNAWPQDLPLGPGSTPVATGPLTIQVDSSVAPGTYTVYVTGWACCAEIQYAPVTVQVLASSPQASAGDFRDATISSTADSYAATQASPGFLTWDPYILLHSTGPSAVLHAPQVTASSTLSFVPAVSMPHTEAGADLSSANRIFDLTALAGDTTFSGTSGHSRAAAAAITPGFDVSRVVSPGTISAAGGTQTVTVSITPRRGDGFGYIEIRAGSIVPGATIDPLTVVPPAADPFGASDIIPVDSGTVAWSGSATVGTTYTLTATIQVPPLAGRTTFKPEVLGEVEVVSTLGTQTGTSTTIPDSQLGGSLAFSSSDSVDWTQYLLDTNDVVLAGRNTPAVDHFRVTVANPTVAVNGPQPVTVTALDAAGNTVTDYAGSVILTDLTGTLQQPGPLSWTAGVGHVTVRILAPSAADRVTATDPLAGATGTNANPFVVLGGVDHFRVTVGFSSVTASGPQPVTVTALDAAGQTVPGYAGPVTLTDTAGVLASPPALSWSGGTGHTAVSFTGPSTGDRIVATDPSSGATGQNATPFTIIGPVDHFRVGVGFSSVLVGATQPVTITALDAAGQTVTGYAGPATLTDTAGVLVPPPAIVWSAGVGHVMTVFSGPAAADRVSVLDAPTGATGSNPVAFSVIGLLDHFRVQVGFPSVLVGGAQPVTVTALDSLGNPVPSYVGPAVLTDSAGALQIVSGLSWAGGVGHATVSFNAPSTGDRVTATDTPSGVTATNPTSFTVIGPAASFRVQVGLPSVAVGGLQPVTVTAFDALGQAATGYAGPVTLTDSAGVLAPPPALTWVAGVGRGSVSFTAPSTGDRLTATDTPSGATGTNANAFTVIGPLSSLLVRVGLASVHVGQGQPVTVTAFDALGQAITGFAGPASITDTAGVLGSAPALVWTSGVGRSTVTFASTTPADRVQVTSGAVSATNANAFVVVP